MCDLIQITFFLTLVGIEFYLSDATSSSGGGRAAPQGEVDVEVLDHELGAGLVLLDLYLKTVLILTKPPLSTFHIPLHLVSRLC